MESDKPSFQQDLKLFSLGLNSFFFHSFFLFVRAQFTEKSFFSISIYLVLIAINFHRLPANNSTWRSTTFLRLARKRYCCNLLSTFSASEKIHFLTSRWTFWTSYFFSPPTVYSSCYSRRGENESKFYGECWFLRSIVENRLRIEIIKKEQPFRQETKGNSWLRSSRLNGNLYS